jgi:hypothetical protein
MFFSRLPVFPAGIERLLIVPLYSGGQSEFLF